MTVLQILDWSMNIAIEFEGPENVLSSLFDFDKI